MQSHIAPRTTPSLQSLVFSPFLCSPLSSLNIFLQSSSYAAVIPQTPTYLPFSCPMRMDYRPIFSYHFSPPSLFLSSRFSVFVSIPSPSNPIDYRLITHSQKILSPSSLFLRGFPFFLAISRFACLPLFLLLKVFLPPFPLLWKKQYRFLNVLASCWMSDNSDGSLPHALIPSPFQFGLLPLVFPCLLPFFPPGKDYLSS